MSDSETMKQLSLMAQAIREKRAESHSGESLLVAISGIDGAGKGYVTDQLLRMLNESGIHAVAINVDGWLNLPSKRFNKERPAEHFYHHAIRFEEMFEQLILPLTRQRSIRVEADFAEETALTYRRHAYVFDDVDVILLEGIYLFKHAFRKHYDWKVWVDCSFETALERALQRRQEGLPAEETVRAYRNIYFPAQEIHFRLDNPRAAADAVFINDARLEK